MSSGLTTGEHYTSARWPMGEEWTMVYLQGTPLRLRAFPIDMPVTSRPMPLVDEV